MEFTLERLGEMEKKNALTKRYAHWYSQLHEEEHRAKISVSDRFKNKAEVMRGCLTYWEWDAYHENKLLDLQKVNTCKDRFCPNCRKVALNRSIQKVQKPFEMMMQNGYMPYMMTLTVPNVSGDELRSTIDKMNKAFSKMWEWYFRDIDSKARGYKNRFFEMKGAIKVLEVTVQKDDDDMYHPHFHVMVFIDQDEDEAIFHKYIDGGYSRNQKKQIYYSDADIQIMKLWYMAYEKISIRNYEKTSDEWHELYICDIRQMDMPGGIYEVFKYTFKDTDIKTYKNFKVVSSAIYGRRLRSGHGELYNLKIDDETELGEQYLGIEEYLNVDEKENPQLLVTKAIRELTITYKHYTKISRHRNFKDYENIQE